MNLLSKYKDIEQIDVSASQMEEVNKRLHDYRITLNWGLDFGKVMEDIHF